MSDRCVWRCPQCKTTKSARENSFFMKSRMPLNKWLLLLHCWVRHYSSNDAGEEAMVDNGTVMHMGNVVIIPLNLCDTYRWVRCVPPPF